MSEPEPDPELAAFEQRPIQVDDDPELVAFEHAIRKRNVIVYVIGGIISLPFGVFFMALSWHLHGATRVFDVGLLMTASGVAFLSHGIRLALGAPMVEDESDRAEDRRKRRQHAARIVVAVLSFVAAAVVLVIGMAGHPGLYPVAAGLFLGGILVTHRAYPARPDSDGAGDADNA